MKINETAENNKFDFFVNIKDNEHKEYRSILPKNFIMQK